MVLQSVDLFTGIGGLVHALDDVCCPLVYCDSDRSVRSTLAKLISKGCIQDAPIVHDVSDLQGIIEAVRGSKVDIVTGGFPCSGFSSMGLGQGLRHEASALFTKVVDIVSALKPPLVLFENVASILQPRHREDLQHIVSTMINLGYSCGWTTCGAVEVSGVQNRKRWFCLCVKRDVPLPHVAFGVRAEHCWKATSAPVLMTHRVDRYQRRSAQLGNSIIPTVGRLAFFRLISGFKILTHSDLIRGSESYPQGLDVTTTVCESTGAETKHCTSLGGGSAPQHCMSCDGASFCSVTVPSMAARDLQIVIDPNHYDDQHLYSGGQSLRKGHFTSKAIPETIKKSLWPTVRGQRAGATHVLNERGMRDIHTMARFTSSIAGQSQPRTSHKMFLNIHWLEWFMGFPEDWTDHDSCPRGKNKGGNLVEGSSRDPGPA